MAEILDIIALWYGMVWYGMVWYGMVWYGGATLHIRFLQIEPTNLRGKLFSRF